MRDDVAQNIRDEMNRDAMPTKEEAEAMHRSYLREEGCAECDEDDPDELDVYSVPMPSCAAFQFPNDPTVVYCEEHVEERETLRERAYSKAMEFNEDDWREEKAVAVTFYECGNWTYVTYVPRMQMVSDGVDGDGKEIYKEVEAPPPRDFEFTTPIVCRCGEMIDEVVKLSEVDC
jgi:hypothetical protein